MQAQVLIGPRRWVSSNKVKFSAIDKKCADFPVLFRGEAYIPWGRRKYPVSFHRVKIKEEEYLFRGRLRTCRIPKGADISIEFRPRASVAIVRVDTKTTSSVVYVSGYGEMDSQQLVAFCRRILKAKALSKFPELKPSVLDILAGHGEPGSIKLFDEYSGGNNLLVKHRNNYECVRLLLSRATGMKNTADAHKLVMQCLFAKEYKPAKGPTFALPKIAPKETEAKKFSKLLKGFVKDHGKIPLTKDDVLRIEELVAEIKEGAKGVSSTPQQSVGDCPITVHHNLVALSG